MDPDALILDRIVSSKSCLSAFSSIPGSQNSSDDIRLTDKGRREPPGEGVAISVLVSRSG